LYLTLNLYLLVRQSLKTDVLDAIAVLTINLKLIKELDTSSIITMVLDDSPTNFLDNGYTAGGSFILTPKTGNFDDISNMIENIFAKEKTNNDTPKQDKPQIDYSYANIEIQNGTWSVGMAARMRKRLEDKNFYIETIGNAEEKPIEQVEYLNFRTRMLVILSVLCKQNFTSQ